jgi:translation initiation factor IF-3
VVETGAADEAGRSYPRTTVKHTIRKNQGGRRCSAEDAPQSLIAIQLQNIRVNGKIRAREVRVILASSGQQLGVMKIQDALRKANELGLDLVEVAPNAEPPVCRIVDFGKFKYEQAKNDKDKRGNAAAKMKEIKFRVNVAQHDYETKLRHAEEFLDKGNKVRVLLQFRGREMAHQELGAERMSRIKRDLVDMAIVEQEPKLQGRTMLMTLAALPAAKRKRHFFSEHDLQHMAEGEAEEAGSTAVPVSTSP